MPLDVQQTLLDRLWELLLARPKFASLVLPGNRINSSEPRWTQRETTRAQSADFPYVRVFASGRAGQKPMLTFCSDVDRELPITVTIEILTVYDFESDTKVLPLEAEIDAALWSAGDNLGLDFVAWFTSRKVRAIKKNRDTDNVRRTVATDVITVECRPLISDLTSP